MKSAFLVGEWYLMGGSYQGRLVLRATVDTLIATTSAGEGTPSVWKILDNELPNERSSVTVLGGHLLAIGGKQPTGVPGGMRIWLHIQHCIYALNGVTM